MKRKVIVSLILICVAAACVAVAGCMTDMEKLVGEGYVVFVTYDANGGNYGEVGQTVRMDAFRPDDIAPEDDGFVHIKLQDFEDRNSFTGVADVKSPVRDSYGFWGWYRARELYLVDGNPVDLDGNVLEVGGEGTYYVKGTDTEGYPVYTYSESDRWDFDNDEILYDPDSDDILEITLYAAWIPNFEFDYCYIDEKGAEVQYGTTSFNYVSWFKNSSEVNTLIVPSYPAEGGPMSYTHSYSSGGSFTFPSRSGYTFSSAYYYLDGEKKEITETQEHWGTFDEDTFLVHDYKMKIYVEFVEGEKYYLIMTAQQFLNYASADVHYTIGADISFTDEKGTVTTWPATISTGTFTGSIVSDGNQRTISNVYVRYGSDTEYGGLFGCIGKDAVVSEITFENVTFDLYSMSRNVNYGFYGLFAGDIQTGATLEDVCLKGALEFTIGAVSCDSTGKSVNFYSNADIEAFGVDISGVEKIILSCYSNSKAGAVTGNGDSTYYYTVVCQGTAENVITMTDDLVIEYGIYPSRAYQYTDGEGNNSYYDKDYYIIYSSAEGE